MKILKEKAERSDVTRTSLGGTPEDPLLEIIISSNEDFINLYSRDKTIYETFFQFMQEQFEEFNGIFEKLWKNANRSPILSEEEDEYDLYLVVKYFTNFKEPIRENYNFTFKIIEILGIKASYEEVEDGFILFYKNKEDFEITQMDLLKLARIKEFLIDKSLWNDNIEQLFGVIQF